MRQLLLALKYCHECNVIHRDIKLENIMTDSTMKHWFLVDFGLAVQTKKKISELAGTGYYMSPGVI